MYHESLFNGVKIKNADGYGSGIWYFDKMDCVQSKSKMLNIYV